MYLHTDTLYNALQNPHELLFLLRDCLDIQVILLFLWSRTCMCHDV